MNKIEKLIKEMCPNGVEYKRIEEICEIIVGGDKPKTCNKELTKPNLEYPFPIYSNNSKNDGLYGFSKTYTVNKKSVSISSIGTIGFHKLREPFYTPIIRLKILIPKNIKQITPEFLNYSLDMIDFSKIGGKQDTTLPSINTSDLQNIEIPILPIEIQNEIVKILDTFTQLEAELEAELEARDKQYQYYRNKLLDFDNNQKLLKKLFEKNSKEFDNKIEYKPLKSIGVFYSGLSGKTKNDFFYNANSKYITYLNVFNNYSINFEILENVQININEKQNKVKYGDILFTTSSETLEECGISSVINKQVNGDVYLNSFCFGFRLNDLEKFDINYLKHLFKSKQLREQIIKCSNGVTRYNLSKTQFENVNIPIPSLEVQTKIVNILDRLQDYSKDIKTGLPLEIEQRQKQYEYYRNLLLDFKANAQGGGISK